MREASLAGDARQVAVERRLRREKEEALKQLKTTHEREVRRLGQEVREVMKGDTTEHGALARLLACLPTCYASGLMAVFRFIRCSGFSVNYNVSLAGGQIVPRSPVSASGAMAMARRSRTGKREVNNSPRIPWWTMLGVMRTKQVRPRVTASTTA